MTTVGLESWKRAAKRILIKGRAGAFFRVNLQMTVWYVWKRPKLSSELHEKFVELRRQFEKIHRLDV